MKFSVMRAPRLRASPRHGGASPVFSNPDFYLLIHRGGVPSGGGGFIALAIHEFYEFRNFNLIPGKIFRSNFE